MAKDDFYNRLFGITPEPPTATLSKLIEMYKPPAPPNSLTTLSKLLENYPPPAPPSALSLGILSALFAAPKTPPPVPAPTGIRFQDRYFSEPTVFASAWLPPSPGVYAILVFDWTCSPRPFRVLYFGKASDLGGRVVRSHEKYAEWNRAASGAGLLYVAYHLMPNTYDWQRAAVEENLIKHYAPVCNRTFNPFGGLFGS
jgi:hypothetical protein